MGQSDSSSCSCDDDQKADWVQLPDDVMIHIIQRLDVSDRARISSACKSWRNLAMRKDIPVPSQFPWLMLPHKKLTKGFLWSMFSRNCNSINFYDTCQGKIYKFNLPKSIEGGWCFCSSKGWLFIADGEKTKPQILMLNPLSGQVILLPSITTIPSYQKYCSEGLYDDFTSFIIKLEVSCEDVSRCTISAILYHGMALAICKPDDEKWTSLFQPPDDIDDIDDIDVKIFTDISFYNGMFYVLYSNINIFNYTNMETVSSFSLEISNCTTVTVKLVPDILPQHYLVQFEEREIISYLVQSRGELLIVRKLDDVLVSEIDYNDDVSFFDYQKTLKFEVYKMDYSRGSLDDDQVLFVGEWGSSLSCSAKDFEGVKGNCIYFLYDWNSDLNDFPPIIIRESGIFCCDNGSISRFYPSVKPGERMTWFTPHLK